MVEELGPYRPPGLGGAPGSLCQHGPVLTAGSICHSSKLKRVHTQQTQTSSPLGELERRQPHMIECACWCQAQAFAVYVISPSLGPSTVTLLAHAVRIGLQHWQLPSFA